MKLFKRSGVAAIAIAGAALIAAGCGGGSGSGSTAAAKDSAVLDLIPKDAIGYITVDTDFQGDNWKQFDELALAFDDEFKGVGDMIADETSDSDDGDKVDFEKDVEPWLGSSGGAALLSAGEDKEGETDASFFVWVELKDAEKFEAFSKDRKYEQGKEIGDFKTLENPDDDEENIAYNDDYAIFTESRSQLEKVVEYDGDSITDADGVSDAIDEVGDDALATLIVGGEGTRKALKGVDELKSLATDKRLEDLTSMAMSVSAEDDGMRVTGFVGADGEDSPENTEHEVFGNLPATTVIALGGEDLGGGLKSIAEEFSKDNEQVQQAIGGGSAALGVDLDDLAKAFDGEFALGVGADDAGLGALVGGVAGAAMGGGASSLDPAALAEAVSITLAFEETGDSSATLEKLAGAVGGLAGATEAPKTGTAGDFSTKQLTVSGFPVTTASSDDVAGLSIGADVFSDWGTETLAESAAYKDAIEAAEAPDTSVGVMWLDAGRLAKLAGVSSSEKVEMGGMVGWIEGDGSNAKFGAFLHIAEK